MFPSLNKTVFSILALFFIGTAAFVLLDSFRGYRAEVTILVLPLATSQTPAEQMVENIAVLPTTVSFLDALLASDERLSEFSSLDEQSGTTRAEQWGQMLSVKRKGGSGVITLMIEAGSQEEATLFARQMTKVLFQKVGTYYDIRSDVSLRLIEGPLVRASLISPVTWIVFSLGIGLSVAIGIMILGNVFRLFIGTPRQKTISMNEPASSVSRPTETTFPSIHPDTFIPKKPTVFFSEESEARAREEKREYNPYLITPSAQPVMTEKVHSEESVSASPVATPPISLPIVSAPTEIPTPKKIVETTPTLITKSEAPSNLPFIDEATFLAQFSSAASQNEEVETTLPVESIESTPTIVGEVLPPLPVEPTVEDYRRRLNELLKEGK